MIATRSLLHSRSDTTCRRRGPTTAAGAARLLASTVAVATRATRPPRDEDAIDVDGFIAANRPGWERLAELTRRVGRDPRGRRAEELDELVRLHLRASSHLSTARTHLRDPELAGYLSTLVARSSAVVHGSRPRTWATLWRGLTETFPAAVFHARRAVMLATAVFLLTFGVVTAWFATTPAAVEASLPAETREAYLERDFEAYYSSEPATTFAARVFTNNAAVGALAFAVGIAFALPTLYVLVLNAVNVGFAAGMFHAAGEAGRFWGLILPHGLLELTAVFVAAGAGLQLGWAAIAPGDRTRREALADEGRRAIVIVLGLVVVFLVAGLIEAFVTPAPWPAAVRVGVGAAVWATFCGWIAVVGRRAASLGLTGAIGERPRAAPSTAPRVP